MSKAAKILFSDAGQESHLIVYVCSRAVSMQMFCQTWTPVKMLSAESHLSFINSVVLVAEGLRKGEFCCLEYRR